MSNLGLAIGYADIDIYIYPEGRYLKLDDDEYGAIVSDDTKKISYGQSFANKQSIVDFIEDMERKAARENKTLKDVLIENTYIQFT